jgi:hypothetical protein
MHDEAGHRFNSDFDLLILVKPADVRLIDMRVDDQVVQVGDSEDFRAAVETAGPETAWPWKQAGQNGAVEGRIDLGFGQAFVEDSEVTLVPFQAFFGQVVFGFAVLEKLHRNEVGLGSSRSALEFPFGLAHLQFGALDFGDFRKFFVHEFFVIQREKDLALFDFVADIDRERLRFYR